MRIRPMLLLPMLGLAVLSARATAQQGDDSNGEQDRTNMIHMKSDLRNFVTAQEAYYADHSAYSADVDQLRFRPSDGVSVRLTITQNNGWAAEARSTALPNVVCSIFINVKVEDRVRTRPALAEAKEGEPVCDLLKQKPF